MVHHLAKSASSYTGLILMIFGVCLVVSGCFYLVEIARLKLSGFAGSTMIQKEDADDIEVPGYQGLPEDVNGVVIATMARDCVYMSNLGINSLRLSRVLFAVLILMATLVLQIGITLQIKLYVTPQAVASIRSSYDKYEFIMYGSLENHTNILSDGTHRGKTEYFQPGLFDTLSPTLKADICNIPFSQFTFIGLILCVWALIVVGQMRSCLETAASLLIATPPVHTMAQGEELSEYDLTGDGLRDRKIVGLTPLFKAALLLFVFLPWLVSLGVLLWLGSRWLAATTSWGDVVANSVALEFIVHIKDLLYFAFVSERTKRDVRNTTISPFFEKEPAGWCIFFGSSIWGLLCPLWVFVYVYKIQSVLPEYNWDVNSVCTGWLTSLI